MQALGSFEMSETKYQTRRVVSQKNRIFTLKNMDAISQVSSYVSSDFTFYHFQQQHGKYTKSQSYNNTNTRKSTRPGFDLRSVQVGIVADEMEINRFFSEHFCYPLCHATNAPHAFTHLSLTLHDLSNWPLH
jgi:hypothetical protein